MLLALLAVATLCPARCVCDEERLEARCGGGEALEDVPWGLNAALRRLSLADNSVSTLAESRLEQLTDLVALNVSGNHVTTLARDALRGLSALEVLDLDRNRLRRLPGGVLAHSPRLTELHLASNSIVSVDADAFLQTPHLRLLDLGDNQLLGVPTPALRPLRSLLELRLGHNLLEVLEAGALRTQGRLRELRLRGNALRRLHRAALDALTSLAGLDLADNNLTSVPTAALASLSGLRALDLSGNNLRSVDAAAFYGLSQLRRLRLCRLPALSRVDERAFLDNGQLQSVYLEDNPSLEQLPAGLFQGLGLEELSLRGCSLRTLHESLRASVLWLADNPLHCNCSLRWLRWGGAALLSDAQLVRCASPEDTALLADAAEPLFLCDASWAAVAVVALAVGALFAATCGLLLVIGSGKTCHRRDATLQ